MRRVRVIPVLLLKDGGVVKTTRFRRPTYVGDPINTLRIFNEKEVDELTVLDIMATREGRGPDIQRIRRFAGECFMPLTYGGGVSTVEQVRQVLAAGVEKVVINSAFVDRPQLITDASRRFGAQSVVVSIDCRRSWRGRHAVYTHGGRRRLNLNPEDAAHRAEELGAGEIFLTSIDREGTRRGYDLSLISQVARAVSIPVVANGGADSLQDFADAVRHGSASAIAAGTMFVFQRAHRAVLITYPQAHQLDQAVAG